MAWPRKISLFRTGNTGMGPVPRPRTPPKVVERSNKRAFMQNAVLKMLDNIQNFPAHSRSAEDLCTRAEQLYHEIERRLDGE